jgi:hypothetical protein
MVRCGMGILPMSGGLSEPRARRLCHFRPDSQPTDDGELGANEGEGNFSLASYYKHSFVDYINRRYE